MYLISRDTKIIRSNHGAPINLDLSSIWKVVRTPACKAGEYALFLKEDNDTDKFSIFKGYISYDAICNSFELIKYEKPKTERKRRKRKETIA